jgi:hypothetical protein
LRSEVSAAVEAIIIPAARLKALFAIGAATFHPAPARPAAAEPIRSGGRTDTVVAVHHRPASFLGTEAAEAAAIPVFPFKSAATKETARRRTAAKAGALHVAIVVHATKVGAEIAWALFATEWTESAREGFAAPHATLVESVAIPFAKPAIPIEILPLACHSRASHLFKEPARAATEAAHQVLLWPASHSHAGARLAVFLLHQFSMDCHEQRIETREERVCGFKIAALRVGGCTAAPETTAKAGTHRAVAAGNAASARTESSSHGAKTPAAEGRPAARPWTRLIVLTLRAGAVARHAATSERAGAAHRSEPTAKPAARRRTAAVLSCWPSRWRIRRRCDRNHTQ